MLRSAPSLPHRFTGFWASLDTGLDPAWPVTDTGREPFAERVPSVRVAHSDRQVEFQCAAGIAARGNPGTSAQTPTCIR